MPSQLNYVLLWLNRILVLKQAYFVYLIHREITTHHDGVMYIMPEHGIYNADMPNPQGILQPIHVLCPLSTRSASIFQSFNVEWSRRYEPCTLESKFVTHIFEGYNSISVMHGACLVSAAV